MYIHNAHHSAFTVRHSAFIIRHSSLIYRYSWIYTTCLTFVVQKKNLAMPIITYIIYTYRWRSQEVCGAVDGMPGA